MAVMFEDLGIPLTQRKIVPGDTITSLNRDIWQYRRWKLNFIDGDAAIVAGDWIVGATSGAVAKVVEIGGLTVGSWTNETGYLIVDSWNGTAFTDTEELKVAANALIANVSGILVSLEETGYPYKAAMAKSALVVVHDATSTHGVLVGINGGKPDQTALIGIPMMAGSSIVLRNIEAIRNFKCVDYVTADASVVQITGFF